VGKGISQEPQPPAIVDAYASWMSENQIPKLFCRDGKFSACAHGPTRAHAQNFVLAAGQVGLLQESRLRPGEAAGCVEKPMIERVTGPATNRRDEVKLFGN
jgi:hypothetical protein